MRSRRSRVPNAVKVGAGSRSSVLTPGIPKRLCDAGRYLMGTFLGFWRPPAIGTVTFCGSMLVGDWRTSLKIHDGNMQFGIWGTPSLFLVSVAERNSSRSENS
jgi:hypothetical protein